MALNTIFPKTLLEVGQVNNGSKHGLKFLWSCGMWPGLAPSDLGLGEAFSDS